MRSCSKLTHKLWHMVENPGKGHSLRFSRSKEIIPAQREKHHLTNKSAVIVVCLSVPHPSHRTAPGSVKYAGVQVGSSSPTCTFFPLPSYYVPFLAFEGRPGPLQNKCTKDMVPTYKHLRPKFLHWNSSSFDSVHNHVSMYP